MKRLSELVNIGEVLAERLEGIGIHSQEELAETGSVEAVLRIKEQDIHTCYSMLCAIEGAIRGVRWHGIPKAERDALKREFDEARASY